nr:hypothetical protein [uncultured Desulfobacter sp.]
MNKLIVTLITCLLTTPVFALNLDGMNGIEPVTQEEQKFAANKLVEADGPCTNDERLSDFSALLKQLRALPKGETLKPLITLTPEKYASLKPPILKVLGDNIIICPDIIVLDGVPTEKLSIKFEVLYNKIKGALINKDAKELKRLYATFIAAPITMADAVNLFTTTPFNENVDDFLSTTLNLRIWSTGVNKTDHHAETSIAAIYGLFNGKVKTDNKPIIFCKEPFDIRKTDPVKAYTVLTKTKREIPYLIDTAKDIGITAYNVNDIDMTPYKK